MFYIKPIEQQRVELIDGDWLALYPDLDVSQLIALTDEQYREFCEKGNEFARLHEGKLVFVVPEPDHEQQRTQQIAQIRQVINAKRDECVNGGVYVPLIDKWVDTNEQGRSTLVEIKADFDLNGHDHQYTLICADNSAVPLDFTAFKAVWDAVKTLKEKMFENAYMHKILLENSDDPQAYDWSIGWAETYASHLKARQGGNDE